MNPDEERLVDDLQRVLQGDMTPTMVTILNDAAIHVAILSGMSVEQIVMQFAQLLSRHVPGIGGVEIRMYGYNGLMPQVDVPSVKPVPKQPSKEDEAVWNLLKGIDLDLW